MPTSCVTSGSKPHLSCHNCSVVMATEAVTLRRPCVRSRILCCAERSKVIRCQSSKVVTLWCPSAILCLLILAVVPVSMATRAARPPSFLLEPSPALVRPGSKVVLRCSATEGATVSWLRDGVVVTAEGVTGVTVTDGYLVIPSLSAPGEHTGPPLEGVYQCVASNRHGAVVSREARVEAAYIGDFYDGFKTMYVNVTEGNVAFIPCAPPSGRPQPITSFQVNGTDIDLSDSHYRLLPSGNLQISAVRKQDNGQYRCLATNPITMETKRAVNVIHLNVVVPLTDQSPVFRWVPPSEVSVARGESLTLECVVEGAPVPVVTWSKYGGKLPADRHRQILGNLEITDVGRLDEGTYICNAGNGIGTQRVAITSVEVKEPPMILQPPANQEVTEGSTVTFQCQGQLGEVRGHDLAVTRKWYHDGERLEEEGEILEIEDVHFSHAGVYQCTLRSSLGSVSAAAILDVTKSTASPGDTRSGAGGIGEMQGIAPALEHTAPNPRPLITGPPANQTVTVGDTVTLECRTSQRRRRDSDFNLLWLKDGDRVASYSSEGQLETARRDLLTSGSLVITGAQLEDAGEYMCVVWGGDGRSDSATATVLVTHGNRSRGYSPRDTTTRLPDNTTHRHDNTTRPDNGAVLEISAGNHGNEGGNHGNEGRGRGKKKNKQATGGDDDGEEGTLEMVPPSKPRVSRVSDTSVLLEWTLGEPPANSTPMDITFYKIQYKEMVSDRRRRRWRTIDTDISGSERQYEVSALDAGSAYRFRIVGVYSNNDNLHGPNSRKVSLRGSPSASPDLPRAPVTGPMIVSARASTSTLSLQWQYLPADWTPVEGFHVYYQTYGGGGEHGEHRHTVNGSHLRQAELTDLLPNTMYSLRMTGYNVAGESHYSNTVVKRTSESEEYPAWVPQTPEDEDEDDDDNSQRTTTVAGPGGEGLRAGARGSDRLLYIVLGGVLGALVLFLLLFMAACAWRQRKAAAMMAAEGRSKFSDPARTIYANQSQTRGGANGGMFLLHGMSSPRHENGSVPGGYPRPAPAEAVYANCPRVPTAGSPLLAPHGNHDDDAGHMELRPPTPRRDHFGGLHDKDEHGGENPHRSSAASSHVYEPTSDEENASDTENICEIDDESEWAPHSQSEEGVWPPHSQSQPHEGCDQSDVSIHSDESLPDFRRPPSPPMWRTRSPDMDTRDWSDSGRRH